MHPAFALASLKLEQLKKEHDRFVAGYTKLVEPLKAHDDEVSLWVRISLTSTGIEHVYTGIENVLKSLVNEVDGGVRGNKDEFHKALLAQCLVEAEGRPAIIGEPTHGLIDQLRGFRHAERNNYIHELRLHDVEDNYNRMNAAMPLFRADVLKFIEEMSSRYAAKDNEENQEGPLSVLDSSVLDAPPEEGDELDEGSSRPNPRLK